MFASVGQDHPERTDGWPGILADAQLQSGGSAKCELLDLLNALKQRVTFADMDEFYYLARAILVKDERHFDKFDRAFGAYFKGLENLDQHLEALIPEDWLRKEFERSLSDEERAQIQSLGGLDKLIEEFKKRLEEQKERHAGGNKWIGTGGTSPFGSGGFNPEGIRVGDAGKRQQQARNDERPPRRRRQHERSQGEADGDNARRHEGVLFRNPGSTDASRLIAGHHQDCCINDDAWRDPAHTLRQCPLENLRMRLGLAANRLHHHDGEAALFRFLRAIAQFPKPLIAAVCGPAVGIGTTLLFHCDLVYAGDNAAFSMPFVNLGLCPEAASSLLVPQMLGYHRAAEALLLGEPFMAEAALEVGLVNRVLPPTEARAYAHTVAAKLAAKPMSSLVETKRLMKKGQAAQVQAVMAEEGASFGRMLREPAAREAFGAFMERRKPDFSKV